MVPLYIQKTILFLLQKGSKDYHIVLGGLIVLFMESTATVKACHVIRQNYIKQKSAMQICKTACITGNWDNVRFS